MMLLYITYTYKPMPLKNATSFYLWLFGCFLPFSSFLYAGFSQAKKKKKSVLELVEVRDEQIPPYRCRADETA